MTVIKLLIDIAIIYGICAVIYRIVIYFNASIRIQKKYDEYMKILDDELNKLINNSHYISLNNIDNNERDYDKTDEELLEDWNNLWGGNPPCELDIKAIREEEKRERDKENNKE